MKKFFNIVFLIGVAISQPVFSRTGRVAKDGYAFESAQFVHKNLEVQIVTSDTEEEWHDQLHKFGLEDGVFAFSEIRINSNKCVIHIIDPRISYHPEELGHEMTHCIYGQFHAKHPDGTNIDPDIEREVRGF